jgi:hypothetical protein
MDVHAYRSAFLTDPQPEPRFAFGGSGGAVLYFRDYDDAVAYYTAVLGDPAYIEGPGTRGWRIGPAWLTLLAGGTGKPENTEITLRMDEPAEAERLQAAFIDAGGTGAEPSDQLMYDPIRACPVTDPFGTQILVYALRDTAG